MKAQKKKFDKILILPAVAVVFLFLFNLGYAQTNVTLYSVSPTSGDTDTPIAITGKNLLQCAPLQLPSACNVQFHDTDARRTTVSGTVVSDTTVNALVPQGLCPGKYNIRVGELANYSNTIPFALVDSLSVQSDPSLSACRYAASITPAGGFSGTNIEIAGRNLHTSVHFFNFSGLKATVIGTVGATYPVDIGGGTIVQFISKVAVVAPASLIPGTYTVRVGSDTTTDISNGVGFNVFGDTSAPSISGVRVTNITPTTADVIWNTDEPADSQVEYCPSYTRCGVGTPLDTNLVTSHVVGLSGLTPNSTYFVWVKSRDSGGNLRSLGYYVFKTAVSSTSTPTPTFSSGPSPSVSPSTPPTPPPVISNVQITNITRDSAIVTWDTDVPTDSRVFSCFLLLFCTKELAYDSTLTIAHTLDLLGLSADKKYYIKIISKDGNGLESMSNFYFKTALGLIISNINASTTQTTLTVSWDTNYPASSKLRVCRFFIFCFTTVFDPALMSSHLVTVPNLRPGTRYLYQLISTDLLGYTYSINTYTVMQP